MSSKCDHLRRSVHRFRKGGKWLMQEHCLDCSYTFPVMPQTLPLQIGEFKQVRES